MCTVHKLKSILHFVHPRDFLVISSVFNPFSISPFFLISDIRYGDDPKRCVAKELKIRSAMRYRGQGSGPLQCTWRRQLLPAAGCCSAGGGQQPVPLLHCTLAQLASRRRGRLEAESARDQASRGFSKESQRSRRTWLGPTLGPCSAGVPQCGGGGNILPPA